MKKLSIILITLLTLVSCESGNQQCEGDCVNGHGIFYNEDGTSFEGDWENHELNGYGEKHWSDNSKFKGDWYKGEFKNTKEDGQGTYYDADMDAKYVGEWKNGKPHGFGRLDFLSNSPLAGEYYEGKWENGVKSGNGFYYWPKGSTYEGPWKNDLQNGIGTYTFPDGDSYEAEFVDGYSDFLENIYDQKK